MHGKSNLLQVGGTCSLQGWVSGAGLSGGPDVRATIALKIIKDFTWKGPSEVSSPTLGSSKLEQVTQVLIPLGFEEKDGYEVLVPALPPFS